MKNDTRKYLGRILLIGLLCFINGKFYSQQYVPFPTSNASWLDSGFCVDNYYTTIGDTIVNGITYHMLFNYEKSYTQGPAGCFNPLSFSIYGFYAGSFRNDSINKKVFFLPPSSTQDTLLYDFNMVVGDSLPTSYKYVFNVSGVPLRISRIDSVLLGGRYHKRFTFNGCAANVSSHDSLRIIEGVGSLQSLLGGYSICDPWGTSVLYCNKENGQIVYSDTSTLCQVITDFQQKEFNKVNFDLYPNPTNGQISIPAIEGLKSIELYNVQGKLMNSLRVSQASEQYLEITGKAGIYLLRLIMDDGTVSSTKIVKE